MGLHWLIDPKEFARGDYVYDLAKLLTSLTGHAHADIGEHEKGNPRLKWTAAGEGRIDFNCILTKRQVQGWQEGLAVIQSLARDLAPRLEVAGDAGGADEQVVRRMKQRLLLALARHFFSAVRFFPFLAQGPGVLNHGCAHRPLAQHGLSSPRLQSLLRPDPPV